MNYRRARQLQEPECLVLKIPASNRVGQGVDKYVVRNLLLKSGPTDKDFVDLQIPVFDLMPDFSQCPRIGSRGLTE